MIVLSLWIHNPFEEKICLSDEKYLLENLLLLLLFVSSLCPVLFPPFLPCSLIKQSTRNRSLFYSFLSDS